MTYNGGETGIRAIYIINIFQCFMISSLSNVMQIVMQIVVQIYCLNLHLERIHFIQIQDSQIA